MHASYFWLPVFSNCTKVVKQYPNCQLYAPKAQPPPTPLHPFNVANYFYKWVIEFMACQPPSTNNHNYIIVANHYFIKWAKAMPTFNNAAATATLFFFNHVIARFWIPKQLVSNHDRNFEDEIWHDLSSFLGFEHQHSSS